MHSGPLAGGTGASQQRRRRAWRLRKTLIFTGKNGDGRKATSPSPRTCHWSAPGCHDSCGVLLYTDKDGKLVKVEGDPNQTYNNGTPVHALPEHG